VILPSKHISEEQALLGVGAVVLRNLDRSQTISGLWDRLRDDPAVGTFERFVLALDLLYIAGAVDLSQGSVRRVEA
jgi:hypothetical protein